MNLFKMSAKTVLGVIVLAACNGYGFSGWFGNLRPPWPEKASQEVTQIKYDEIFGMRAKERIEEEKLSVALGQPSVVARLIAQSKLPSITKIEFKKEVRCEGDGVHVRSQVDNSSLTKAGLPYPDLCAVPYSFKYLVRLSFFELRSWDGEKGIQAMPFEQEFYEIKKERPGNTTIAAIPALDNKTWCDLQE